ncbi:hypothetical protein ACOSP7_022429 [Xanthoceras sorbifolium]
MDSSQTLESCVEHQLRTTNQRVQRGQWIRAAILGANDGLLSTTSLMLGVGAAKEDRRSMVLSGLAGALAGACSMAVGEFVSVSTQRDIERATTPPHFISNIQIPDQHHHVIKLNTNTSTAGPTSINETKQGETALAMSNALTPSTNIFSGKFTNELNEKMSPPVMVPESKLPPGFSPGRSPMMKVITEDAKVNTKKLNSPVVKMITKDAKPNTVKTWEENEEEVLPSPFKAAVASATAFLFGSFVPLVPALFIARYFISMLVIAIVTTIALALFGGFGAHLGGSPVRISAARVVAGGWIAMGITYGLLKPFDTK